MEQEKSGPLLVYMEVGWTVRALRSGGRNRPTDHIRDCESRESQVFLCFYGNAHLCFFGSGQDDASALQFVL